MWKTHHYRQFSLSLRKESTHNFSKFNPLNTDTPSIPLLEVNETSNIFSPRGGGGTPLYVLPKGYVVFVPFQYEKGYSLCPFCLESGLV